MWQKLLAIPAINLYESMCDVLRDRVTPVPGSVLYCDLAFGYMEHSGIYIGNNNIVHLSGRGTVEVVSPEEFIENTTAVSIYVSSRNGTALGCAEVARRAKASVGRYRDYNFLLDNCHQFSAGCLSGDFDNSNNFLWMLKDESKKYLGANEWRCWNRS